MLFTWLVAAFIAGALVGTFLDEIVKWAEKVFNGLSYYIKKAWVYICRVPGALKEMVRYIKDGRMVEEPREVSWAEIVAMHERGEIDDDTFRELERSYSERKIADLER